MPKKEIIIFSAQIQLSKIKEYFSFLQEKYHQNVKIYFILDIKLKRKIEELRYIRGIGGKVKFIDHGKHFVIIDQYIVWNMNFDVLGTMKSGSYGTRIESAELANEVREMIDQEEKTGLFQMNFEVSE